VRRANAGFVTLLLAPERGRRTLTERAKRHDTPGAALNSFNEQDGITSQVSRRGKEQARQWLMKNDETQSSIHHPSIQRALMVFWLE